MLLALLLLLQVKVEVKEVQSSYRLTVPKDYNDRRSWTTIVDLGDPAHPVREPDCFVVAPADREKEAVVLACLADLKTKYRVHPERIVVRGDGGALALAAARPEVFAACAVQRSRGFVPPRKAPPCAVFVEKGDPAAATLLAGALVMRRAGIDVEVRPAEGKEGEIFAALGPRLRPRGDLAKADEYQRAGRFCDASLICFELLDNSEVERLARTKLKSIEGAAIMELAKVEVAMADKKYKDAILRCREAARQFAWVPPGERIRKRLAELELRPEVKRALELED